MKVREHLAAGPFTLSMSCSFFGYFAHCGALAALTEAGLTPAKVTGSSAGAVVAGLYGAGYGPDEMEALFGALDFSDIFAFRPAVYWGFPYFGVFRQRLDILEEKILSASGSREAVTRIEDCRVPVGLSVYDTGTKKLRVLRKGRLASAVASSAAVPGLMHGVDHDDGTVLLDAGVGGDMLGVAGCDPADRIFVVNLFLRAFVPETPKWLPHAVIVDLYGIPFVTPNALATKGPLARQAAYAAMKRALDTDLLETFGGVGARRFSVRPDEPGATDDEVQHPPDQRAHASSVVDLLRS